MGVDDRPRRQPARAEPRSLPADQDRVPDSPQRPGGEASPPAARLAVPFDDAAAAVQPGGRRPGPRARDGGAVPQGQRGGRRRLRHPDPLGPRRRRDHAPIPSLLAVAGVHHHLVREGTRNKCGLLIETGDAREVHHVALLLGYGAGAVNPYLAFETLDDLIRQGLLPDITHNHAVKRYIKALNKGVLKVMSKMGISTLQSYCGAQIFEAVGLDRELRREVLHVHRVEDRRRRREGDLRRSPPAPRARLRRAAPTTRAARAAASTSGGATASCTSSIPTRCSSCSTRRAPGQYSDLQGLHAAGGRPEPGSARRCAACSA